MFLEFLLSCLWVLEFLPYLVHIVILEDPCEFFERKYSKDTPKVASNFVINLCASLCALITSIVSHNYSVIIVTLWLFTKSYHYMLKQKYLVNKHSHKLVVMHN